MNRFLIGAAALGVALPAMAQVAPMADHNQTRAEVVAKVQKHFAKMDINRDGAIVADEMQSMRGQHMGQHMGKHGGDMAMRDGPMGNPNAMFDRLDGNRDGMISRDEFAKGREMRIERKVVINGAPAAEGSGDRKMMKMHNMSGGRMLKMADANKDGRITLPEMTASALQRFDRTDTNRDGIVTQEERKAMHQQRQQERARNIG